MFWRREVWSSSGSLLSASFFQLSEVRPCIWFFHGGSAASVVSGSVSGYRDCSLPDAPVRAVLQREYWSGLPFPPLGDLPSTGIEPAYPLYPASCLDRQVLYHQCRLLFPWGSAFKVSFRDPEPKSFFCHHHSSHPSNYKQTNIKEKQTFKIVFHFLGFLIFFKA